MSANPDHTEDVILGLTTLSNQLITIEKKLEELLTLTKQYASHWDENGAAAERTRHEIDSVERYTSRSGNTTYKAFNQDGDIIYLRLAYKTMLQEAGLWNQLSNMHEGDIWAADIVLYTVPDGDFMKPVAIEAGGWVKVRQPDNPGLDRLKELVASGDFVILDTETTALDGYVCQLGILSATGETLLNTLVKPPVDITAEATAVHGITNEMVKDAPTLESLKDQIMAWFVVKTVVGWNVKFDLEAIDRVLNFPDDSISSEDAMLAFAPIYGEQSDFHQGYKWQKLTTAAQYYAINTNGAHNALDDCRMTLAVVKKMVAES